MDTCSDAIGNLISNVGEDHKESLTIIAPELELLQPPYIDPDSLTSTALEGLKDQLKQALQPLTRHLQSPELRETVQDIVAQHFTSAPPLMLQERHAAGIRAAQASYDLLLSRPTLFDKIQMIGSNPSTAPQSFATDSEVQPGYG